jgi:hypothetical protein
MLPSRKERVRPPAACIEDSGCAARKFIRGAIEVRAKFSVKTFNFPIQVPLLLRYPHTGCETTIAATIFLMLFGHLCAYPPLVRLYLAESLSAVPYRLRHCNAVQ